MKFFFLENEVYKGRLYTLNARVQHNWRNADFQAQSKDGESLGQWSLCFLFPHPLSLLLLIGETPVKVNLSFGGRWAMSSWGTEM